MSGSRTVYRASRVLGVALFTALAVGWTSSGDDEVWAVFGYAVVGADVNGDGYADVVVGAPGINTTNVGAGRAYVFLGSAAGPSETAAWTFSPSEMGGQYAGTSLAAGDVNDDGYDDLVVGAPTDGDSLAACAGFFSCSLSACAGTAYLFLGSASGLGDSPAWTSYGNGVAGERFGASLATGDVNGDGYDDLVVGADNFDGAPSTTCAGTGSAYVFLGGSSGLSPSPSWTSSGDAVARAEYGDAVSIGDLNGDGYGDVVVGAPMGYATPTTGRVFVYSGSSSGPASVAAWTADGSAGLGDALAAEGDLDGDGYDDLVVRGSLGSVSELVHVYPGSAAGLPAAPVRSFTGEDRDAYGLALSTAGDVNGDGYADLLVGARTARADVGGTPRALGGALLYLGGPFEGPAPSPVWASNGDAQEFSFFGAAVSIAGDVNRDGYADVLVGASLFTTANEDAGKVYLYFGANAPSGVCDPAGVTCDDGDPCTAASACDLAGLCSGTSPAPIDTPCDDDDPITTGDVCDGAGACRGEAPGFDAGPDVDAGVRDGGADAAPEGPPPTSGGCACAVSGPRVPPRSTHALLLALLLAVHRGCGSHRSRRAPAPRAI